MRVLLPKQAVSIDPHWKLFFLAGPVRGGGDWQKECCEELSRHVEQFYAAVPCRYPESHLLRQSQVQGNGQEFDRQLNWERHYLEIAASSGCLIFWLPCESEKDPHPGPEPYAMDTRGELGEWRGRLMANPTLRMVIGAEEGFYGLSQIQRNFSLALGRDFPIHPTLKETVLAAIRASGV